MKFLPDPFHPAVVHFPIVLIVLGAVAAVIAVVWRRGHLPRFAAVLLGLGALGAWVAVQSGESDGGLLETGQPQMEALMDAHETWAKRTLTAAAVAAVAAVGAVLLGKFPLASRGASGVAAAAAVVAALAVYQTGHRGGALVFRHGAGVQVAATPNPSPAASAAPAGEPVAPPRDIARDRD